MRPRNGLPLRKSLVLAVIIGAHVLVVVVLSRPGKLYRSTGADVQPEAVLFFFEWPPPVEELPSVLEPDRSMKARPITPPQSSTAITIAAEELPDTRAIDWYAEVDRLGQEDRDKASKGGPRTFGEIPKSPYTQKKKKTWTAWEPQERRAGFEGPLPYVRLGKRCIIMPPFFGCAIGKLPKSRGITLEEITDPQRPRRSVPDSANPQLFPQSE